MTIIRPNQHKNTKHFTIFGIGIVVAALLFQIIIYSNVVTLRHDIITLKDLVGALETENSDLRTHLYSITDHANIERLAQEEGFIHDKNPKWVSAILY